MAGIGGSQPLELFGSNSDALRAAIQAEIRSLYGLLPVIVKEQSDGHNAMAQPVINALVRKDDGTMTQLPWPTLQTMVVHFTGGGQVVETHPIHVNDEGLVAFLSRAIDSWRQSGGTQNPIDARQHHPSDHVYIGGVKSDPNKIQNYQPDSMQHRSLDAKVTHDVHPTNGITHKVVSPSDTSSNPFESATIYAQTVHAASSSQIQKTSTDGNNLNTLFLALTGILGSVKNSSVDHTFSCPTSTGPTLIGQQGGNTAQVLVNPTTGLQLQSTAELLLSSPAGINLSTPNLSMPSGAAAGNVGALGGDLSGTLPNPEVVGIHLKPLTSSTLPSPIPGGQICYVTDSNTLTNGATYTGGGTDTAVVRSNGANWIVLG